MRVLSRVFLLERKPQSKLDLSRSAQGIDTCSHPNPIYVMSYGSSAVNLASGSREQPIECSAGQVKIGKIEKVIKTGARLDCDSFSNRVRPRDFKIQSAQPRQINLSWRGERHRRRDGTQGTDRQIVGVVVAQRVTYT